MPTETPAQKTEDWDDLIGRVYDVALDPARYEDLLDTWESTVGPLRSDANRTILLEEPSLIGHFERADAVLDGMGARAGQDEVTGILAQFETVAAVVISDRLGVLGLNPGARHLLGAEVGTPVSAFAIEPQDRAALARHVAKMLHMAESAPSVFRVRAAEVDRFIVFHMRRAARKDGAPIVIAVTSDLRWPAGFADILNEAFGLSNAETDVVRLLVECCSVKDIAATRGRSVETVRAQVKAILAKTETRSQIELIRLALSMMDIAGVTADASPGPRLLNGGTGSLTPLSFQTTYGPDGRAIDYLVYGDPLGTPVLFFHMDFGMIRWPASAEAEAKRLGLKIIAPVRGGFGGSDAIHKGASFGETAAADALAVLDAEDVSRCPVIALAADHMIALAMERQRPGTLSAIIAAAGYFPCVSAEQVERMHKWHRFIQAGARYTPHLLPFLVKAGFHLARRNGKRAFVHSVFGASPADIETFEDPEVFEALVTGSEICLSDTHSGHRAFTEQTLWEHSAELPKLLAWSADLGLPYHSLNGLQDPGTHADTIAEHRAMYPWIEFETYEDAGQLLFFRHWRDVLALTLRYV
ncbi:helix-turn-helix transcriptional regulator [Pseudaestuariivita sp.]|uniref:helix-turn-helix transcriptional regulator n=1 Tax=Pseudaestuariivita sp. TaxID=2211669 RepID=UPI004059DE85